MAVSEVPSCSSSPSTTATATVPKGPPRRAHRKTKTGCANCKKRRVKCDEQRPSCGNCTRRGNVCEFRRAAAALDPSTELEALSAPSAYASLQLNMLDLQLMGNFVTATYATLSQDPSVRHFWRDSAVPMAYKNDYMMRAMLTVSALHMAHKRPQDRSYYMTAAVRHHRVASRQAIEIMANVTSETAVGLFLFSILTIVVGLAGRDEDEVGDGDGGPFFSDGNFPEWIFLMQGTRSLLMTPGINLAESEISALFIQRALDEPNTNTPPSPMSMALEELKEHVTHYVTDQERLSVFLYAIDEMHTIARVLDKTDRPAPRVWTWMYDMSADFFPLLRALDQEAVAIFTFFCVALKRLEAHWWMGSWGLILLRRSVRILDERHRLWVTWPMEDMGVAFEDVLTPSCM